MYRERAGSKTFVMRPPDMKCKAEAWICPLNKDSTNWQPDHDGTLAIYLVKAQWAHPFWSWYAISLLHLRPIPGVQPAHKHYPEAEYELMILALDPNYPPPDPDHIEKGIRYLTPIDLVHQFHGLDDSGAIRVLHECVEAIVQGNMSPDQDFREAWKIGIDNLVKNFYKDGQHRLQ